MTRAKQYDPADDFTRAELESDRGRVYDHLLSTGRARVFEEDGTLAMSMSIPQDELKCYCDCHEDEDPDLQAGGMGLSLTEVLERYPEVLDDIHLKCGVHDLMDPSQQCHCSQILKLTRMQNRLLKDTNDDWQAAGEPPAFSGSADSLEVLLTLERQVEALQAGLKEASDNWDEESMNGKIQHPSVPPAIKRLRGLLKD